MHVAYTLLTEQVTFMSAPEEETQVVKGSRTHMHWQHITRQPLVDVDIFCYSMNINTINHDVWYCGRENQGETTG